MKRKVRLGDDWEPMWRTRQRKQEQFKKRKNHERAFPPDLTNHQRHVTRRKARQDALKLMREATANGKAIQGAA